MSPRFATASLAWAVESVLSNQMAESMVSMTVDAIAADRDGVAERLRSRSVGEIAKMGPVIVSPRISINSGVGVFENGGEKAASLQA